MSLSPWKRVLKVQTTSFMSKISTSSSTKMTVFNSLKADVVKVKAVTHRKDNPIMQTTIGPSEEHVSMAGIPTEASILALVDKAIPG